MKKKMIFGLAMASIALLPSCSNDETVDLPSGKPIEFSGSVVDKSTRSQDPSYTTSNLEEFDVYGWASKSGSNQQVFDGVAVSFSKGISFLGTVDHWTYGDNTQYWIDGASYTFSALAGYHTHGTDTNWQRWDEYNGTLTMNDTGVRTATPKIEGFKSDGKTDLIYSEATATGKASGNDPVGFTFQHQLAKVKFSFQNNTNPYSNIDAKITDIKMLDPIETGDVELSATQYGAVWSNQKKAEDGQATPLEFGDAYDTTTGYLPIIITEEDSKTDPYASCTYERLVIPADETQTYKVTFHVTVLVNKIEHSQFDYVAEIKDVEFKPGYAYNFKADLNEGAIDGNVGLKPIEFDGFTVAPWTDDTTNTGIWTKIVTEKDTDQGDGENDNNNDNQGDSQDSGTTGGGNLGGTLQ